MANKQIAGAIEFAGPAVERDEVVRDRNNSPKPEEATWIENLYAQADVMGASEVAFFDELRKRQAE